MKKIVLWVGLACVVNAGAVMEPATPESQGVSSQAILNWLDACEKKFDASYRAGALHGFVLVRHGKVIAEGSWKPFDTLNKPHMLFSHSKSFTSSAIGFLVDDGKLDLDERVVDLFPEEMPTNACENLKQMRVRDLLTMNHGEEKGHTIYGGGNWVRNFMNKEFTHKPGTRMWYDSDATYMLSAIVAKKSGMDPWAFIKARLFDKIGIEKAWTVRSPQGIPMGGSGMNMTTRELSCFGQFYLQNGSWNGEQLLSTDWVTLATSRQTWCVGINIQSKVVESGSDWRQGYGFQFWRCQHNAYRADGAAGQLSVVMPDQDAVLSVHAGLPDMQAELNLLWEHLLPAMKDGALPEDPALQAKLRDRLAHLAIAPVAGSRTGAAASRLGDTFVFGENERNLKSIRFDPTATGWQCTLVTPSGEQRFPVGCGTWEHGEASFDSLPYATVLSLVGTHETAASGAFDADGTFRVRVFLPGGTTSFLFELPVGNAPLRLAPHATAVAKCPRVVKTLESGWTCDGEAVTLPHTWNAQDAADGIGRADDWRTVGYSSGATSYVRKAVSYRCALPDPKPGKRYFLKCAGASVKCTTRVNGREIGRHTGAFTAFCHEATTALKPTDNVLEMIVDNRVDWNVQPIHADFSVYGGIYRVPEWIETGAIAIDPVTDGVSGVVLEPNVKTGEIVARVTVLGGTNEVQRFRIPDFKLWTPEKPVLYPLHIVVRQNGAEDAVNVRVGFRTAEFRPDGFYLNGEKRKLRGVNRHQDRADRGWGRSREDEAEDVRWMKLMGADAVRTSHYPQSPAFYDLCDEAGLLVWTEAPNVNGLTFTEEARQNELREAREMVMQHRNHPSVVMWGLFNELYNKASKTPYEPRMEALRKYIESLDPTRPTVAASNDPELVALNAVPEAIGLNLYPGWYYDGVTDMDKWIDKTFAKNPTRKSIAVSEYGCSGAVCQHAQPRFRMPNADSDFHPEEYQAWLHWGNYRAIAADPRVWGSFAWVMFDAGSDAKCEGPRHGINDKGLVTWDRSTAKDAFYFYKANWNPEPELHLVGARMTETKSERVPVMAFSNVGPVELFVNGRSLGAKEPDGVKTVFWEDVALNPGTNVIEIRSRGFRRTATWESRPLAAFPKVGKPRAITSGPKEHLLANYFAIDAWSPDFRYVLALETDLNGRLPEANERCTLGLVDLKDGNRFIPVTTTACWNFQEAAMAFWMDNDTILFNDVRDGKFRTVVMDWRTKAERVLPMPVSAVSEDRTWAVSVNYARLSLTRPDYGYAGPGQDARETVEWPEDDGLWTMDLKTGETKLVLSVAQGRKLMPPTRPEAGKPGQPLAYYCHTVISKDGQKIFFLARSVDWFDKVTHEKSAWLTTSFTVNRDGTDLRRCFKDNWAGSHFNWAPDGSHRMLVTAIWDGDKKPGLWWDHQWSLVEFTVGEEEKVRRIGAGVLDQDWHCVYSPDGQFMSGETYWNNNFERPWVLVRLKDGRSMPVGTFYVPEKYRGGYWRCDLHARWRPDGKQLGFNSVHEGSRQIYVMDVDWK